SSQRHMRCNPSLLGETHRGPRIEDISIDLLQKSLNQVGGEILCHGFHEFSRILKANPCKSVREASVAKKNFCKRSNTTQSNFLVASFRRNYVCQQTKDGNGCAGRA